MDLQFLERHFEARFPFQLGRKHHGGHLVVPKQRAGGQTIEIQQPKNNLFHVVQYGQIFL